VLPIAEYRGNVVRGVYRALAFPMGEPILLFALLPGVQGKLRLRNWLLPVAVAACILAATFARNSMVLGGELAGMLNFPTNHADSVTSHTNFSQRIEALTSLIPAAAGILEAAVTLLFVSQGVRALADGRGGTIGVVLGAAAAMMISVFVYDASVRAWRYAVWPSISVPLQVLAPLVCAAVGAVRRKIRLKMLANRLKRRII